MSRLHFYVIVFTSATGGIVAFWVCLSQVGVSFSAAGFKDSTNRMYSTVLISITGNSITF
jgi:hypothetical protein